MTKIEFIINHISDYFNNDCLRSVTLTKYLKSKGIKSMRRHTLRVAMIRALYPIIKFKSKITESDERQNIDEIFDKPIVTQIPVLDTPYQELPSGKFAMQIVSTYLSRAKPEDKDLFKHKVFIHSYATFIAGDARKNLSLDPEIAIIMTPINIASWIPRLLLIHDVELNPGPRNGARKNKKIQRRKFRKRMPKKNASSSSEC